MSKFSTKKQTYYHIMHCLCKCSNAVFESVQLPKLHSLFVFGVCTFQGRIFHCTFKTILLLLLHYLPIVLFASATRMIHTPHLVSLCSFKSYNLLLQPTTAVEMMPKTIMENRAFWTSYERITLILDIYNLHMISVNLFSFNHMILNVSFLFT